MVHRLIEQHLDTSGAYSSQSLNKLKTVINEVSFPRDTFSHDESLHRL
jgi:hypothetical protein